MCILSILNKIRLNKFQFALDKEGLHETSLGLECDFPRYVFLKFTYISQVHFFVYVENFCYGSSGFKIEYKTLICGFVRVLLQAQYF